MEPIWKHIYDYPNYEISETGDIRNVHTNHLLKHKIDKGYHRVALYNDNGKTYKCVHRLVAETFYGFPEAKYEVNHVNGDKSHNELTNLEYCSRSENMKHAYRTGLKRPSGGLPERPVRVVETNEVYPSAYECARQLNCNQGHINHCLTGSRKTHNGYHFEYADMGGI